VEQRQSCSRSGGLSCCSRKSTDVKPSWTAEGTLDKWLANKWPNSDASFPYFDPKDFSVGSGQWNLPSLISCSCWVRFQVMSGSRMSICVAIWSIRYVGQCLVEVRVRRKKENDYNGIYWVYRAWNRIIIQSHNTTTIESTGATPARRRHL
jgi:hypothetical protein